MIETTATLGLTEDKVQTVLATAVRAPSLHNTQPWIFHTDPQTIELRADPDRWLRAADPTGRELRIGCGAALFNLRLGLLGAGVKPLVTVLPEPGDPDLIARVRRGGNRRLTPEERLLLEAVPRRHTNRRPFADAPVATADRHALRRAALDEGAWLEMITDPVQRTTLSALARRAHELQTADPEFVAELDRWTGHGEPRTDGVPATSGGPLPWPSAAWVMRDFTGGGGAQGHGYEPDPLIAVLTVHADGPREDIRAGEAMQRVLLTATVRGLAVSFLSQLVEVPEVRTEMRRLLNRLRPPEVVLRIGHGHPVPATPRRPLDEVLDTEAERER
jgi:nitroreductase